MGRRRKSHHELPQRVYPHGKGYRYVPIEGNPIDLGSDLVHALARYAQIVGPMREFRSMGDVIDGYLRDVAPLKAKRTYNDNLKEAAKLKAVFGRMDPGDIKPSDLYRYRRERNAPVRANREISLLSSIFVYAIEQGCVESNPCKQYRRAPEAPRDRYVEHWERRKFANEFCPDWLRAYLLLKYLTGLRQGDMLKLGQQHLSDKGVYIRTGKRGKRMLFRWTWALRIVVNYALKQRKRLDTTQLFVSARGKPFTQNGFSTAWQRAMRKWLAAGYERFREHDIRAKVASDSDDLSSAQSLLGDSPEVTAKVYKRGVNKVTPLR